MIFQDAYHRAQQHLDETVRATHAQHPKTKDIEIVVCYCEETDDAWKFSYQSRQFLEHGDINSSLVGNAPVVVPKSGQLPYIGEMF